jgi:nucleoside-diphosphate-sugar epimerase
MMNNETIFVTGFPGFLATRLVKRLAHEGARFILLTQPAFVPTAREAIQQIVRETGSAAANFRIVDGDITQPDLGLSPDELARARRETGTIFHLAAIYDLAVDCGIAAHVNVEGTLNINEFAKSVEKLHRYHYISTCYVAGKRQGLIRERMSCTTMKVSETTTKRRSISPSLKSTR